VIKEMKGMCYIVLIIAFLMFYQREPIFTIIIIGIVAGLYLFFRSRKSSSRRRRGGFFSSITGRTDDRYERNNFQKNLPNQKMIISPLTKIQNMPN
jgi:5-bromo-4-chloroindolyl phosphate hydrolysis protein